MSSKIVYLSAYRNRQQPAQRSSPRKTEELLREMDRREKGAPPQDAAAQEPFRLPDEPDQFSFRKEILGPFFTGESE